jgi:ubiquitin-activating enzyme E1
MHSAAAMRACNYEITRCDRGKTKMIAGKIIPAVATTTAMITGCVAAEILKVVQGFDSIEKYKNAFANLALPIFLFSEPDEIRRTKTKYDPIMGGEVKAIPEGFTHYDKTVIDVGSLTFQGLFDWFQKEKGLTINMVACGTASLYNQYLPGNKHKPRLVRPVEEVYCEIMKEEMRADVRYMILVVSGETEDGDDFAIPTIKYVFRQK